MPNYSGSWTITQQMQAKSAGTWTFAPQVPGAPTIGTATAGVASASVTFTAPADPGFPATITAYTVTASPGGATGTGASSPITVSGLSNGTAYTFTVTATNATGTGPASAASNSATPTAPTTLEYLVVAGGGGGGGGDAGGGGAGGFLANTTSVVWNTPLILHVGDGGEKGVAGANYASPAQGLTGGVGSPGANSVFGTVISNGGGFGSSEFYPGPNAGSGGSGGGAGYGGSTFGPGTPGQGNAGNLANQSDDGGGGGGAGAQGTSALGGGMGGVGLTSSITGYSVYYAGGGGGGQQGPTAVGGLGGGGAGGFNSAGINGTVNTGGGGGGGGHPGNPNNQQGGGTGGSGIVILKYPSIYYLGIGSALTSNSVTSGSNTITSFTAGFGNIEFSNTAPYMEYLIVAGGGGGSGGGGGAGGVLTGNTIFSGSYTVTVGAGGSLGVQTSYPGSAGANSSIVGATSYIAIGGGFGGGGYATPNGIKGGPGGSGGGCSIGSGVIGTVLGGVGTDGQGNMGGMAVMISPYSAGWTSGGGGGAGQIGRSSTNFETGSNNRGGIGGVGRSLSITGGAVTYGAGGTGYHNSYGQNGPANTGDGGYGSRTAGQGSNGWDGGSGVVVIAYPNTYPALTVGAGLTYNQPSRSGYRVYRFTLGSGTITF